MNALRASHPQLIRLLPLSVLLVPLLSSSNGLLDMVSFVLVYGLFAMSLNLLVGYSGLVSFGHAMYFAISAYAFCLALQSGLSTVAAFLVAITTTVLSAFLVGSVCVRLRETHFSFITLAFAMLVYNTIELWAPITGGDNGLTGMIRDASVFGVQISAGTARYYFIAVVFCVAVLLMFALVRSSFGTALKMIRDNESRTSYLGINVYLTKLAAFTLSAAFAAVAGVLATLLVSGAYPSMAYWTASGDAIFAILLGGSRVFYGPLVGAAIYRILVDGTTRYTGNTSLVLGLLILLIVLVLKKGPVDLLSERLAERRYARAKAAASDGKPVQPDVERAAAC